MIPGMSRAAGPIRVAVGAYSRVPLEDLDAIELSELKRLFEHENKKVHVLKAMGKSLYGVERTFRTWSETRDGWFAVPRGGFLKIRDFAARAGREIAVRDERTDGQIPAEQWPALRVVPRDYQEEFVRKMVDFDGGILRAPTGCVVGSAIVVVNRAKIARPMRLDHAVRKFNGLVTGQGKRWRADVPTFVRAPMPDGTVRLARVIGAKESGERDVYRVKLAGGFSVDATIDHPMLTPSGWYRLEDLEVGDFVMVDPARGGRPKSQRATLKRSWYKLRVVREHPYAGRRGVDPRKGGWTVFEHRLVAEARENGMTLDEFMSAVARRLGGLKFLDPGVYAVHHKDENPRNNLLENLEVLTHEEHRRVHRDVAIQNIVTKLEPRAVRSIEHVGRRETFDLEVERASAFMANNIAVHNSGKTVGAIVAAHRIGLPTIFCANTGKLFEQWIGQICKVLGLSEGEVGIVRGKKCRLRTVTVAMLKTLSMLPRDHEVFSAFGLFVLDEAQTSPAPTGRLAVNPFRSRKRFAVSADERRKDEMEPMIYEMFGDVLCEVSAEKLEGSGAVIPVDIFVVPSSFRAGWYKGMGEKDEGDEDEGDESGDYARLISQIEKDPERNDLCARIVAETPGATFAMVSHREHGLRLEQLASSLGCRSGMMFGGEDYSAIFDETLAGLEAGTTKAGFGTYLSIGTGIDVPRVHDVVMCTPAAANMQRVNQAKGRACRPWGGEKRGRVWYVWDREVEGFKKHLANLDRWFPGRVYVVEGGRTISAREYRRGARRPRGAVPGLFG